MRLATKLIAGCSAFALIAISAAPAVADPPKGVTPRPADVVGVGTDTFGYLADQLSHDYNKAHPQAATLLYGWDELDPATGKPGGPIVTKAGCAAIARPDGSSAGITALEANTADPSSPSHFCIDYAGSSRGPAAGDPPCASGGICFIRFADDVVTWASRDAASGGTDAPASLTVTQLKDIYLCKITNWATVGGVNAPIKAFLPQTSSGLRAFWLAVLGGKAPITPGPCVSDLNNTLQDNQGTNPALNTPNTIVPYSVADYVAQVYRDARCIKPSCTGSPPCKPTRSQNMFGCDQHGVLGINEVGGTMSMLPWPPPPPPCATCAINPNAPLRHDVYFVVRDAPTADHIPAYLEPFFASAGYACADHTARKDVARYGFITLPWSAGPAAHRLRSSKCGISQHIRTG
jgi:ABC-type phosphate transport system substrate-binding protein